MVDPVDSSEDFRMDEIEGEMPGLAKRDFTGVHVSPCPENLVMVGSGK